MRVSLTHTINQNLHYVALTCIVLLAGILLHRITRIMTHALVSTIISIQYPSQALDVFKSSLQKYAHHSLIGHALSFLVLIFNAFVHLAVTSFRALVTTLYILSPLVIFSVIMVVINEKWAEFMVFIIDSFNTSMGGTFHTLIMFPIEMLDLVGSNVLPALNLCIYIVVQTPIQLVYAIAIGDGKNHFISFVKGTAESFPEFTSSFGDFVHRNAMSCREHMTESGAPMTLVGDGLSSAMRLCQNDSCTVLSGAAIASACFEHQKREIDLFAALSKFQNAAGHGIMTIGSSCHALALFMNVTLYPLVDPDLWMSLDRAGNAILNAFVSAPSSAIQRCAIAGGLFKRPAMCTPDFGHAFDLLSESSILFGNAMTNWIDMGYNIIKQVAVLQKKDLIFDYQQACNMRPDFEYVLSSTNEKTRRQMMGSNVTVLVRMTPSTFVLTDGYSAVFVEQNGPLRRSYAPHIWPSSSTVQPEYGIARTIMPSGSSENDEGVGLFGCSCTDHGDAPSFFVSLQCTIVTKSGNSWILPVEWSLSTQAQLLTCSRLKIVVQSLRWPQKRVLVSNLNAGSDDAQVRQCSAKKGENCLAGDVVIYAIPICGSQDGKKAMSCFPQNYFTKGMCFPYCMALHMRGELAQPITMRGAWEWENGVLIADRDCMPFQNIQNKDISSTSGTIKSTCTVQSSQSTLRAEMYQQVTSSYAVQNDNEANACSFRTSCITEVQNKSMWKGGGSNEYTSPIPSNLPIVADSNLDNDGVRLFLDFQPLVVAGGVQMRRRKNRDVTDSLEYIVDFPTLVGNAHNEFTVEYHADIGVPVAERASVPAKEAELANAKPGYVFLSQSLDYVQDKVPHSPSVLSVDVMWYATNPSFDWIKGMINYCTTQGELTQTQIMFLSSYSSIRLWRIQYKRSACYFSWVGNQKTKTCSRDVSKSFGLEDGKYDFPSPNADELKKTTQLMDMCVSGKEYNMWVESMEDFDEHNVLIAVRRAQFKELGYLLSSAAARGNTAFYFLSKFHHKMQEAAPWTIKDYRNYMDNITSPSKELLASSCPKIRLLPDIGKFVGHSLSALVHLFKLPVNGLLNPFALQEILIARSQQRCPENGLRHSVLENCGMKLFSLEDYFEDMYAANEAFWEIASWLMHQIIDYNDVKSKELEMFGQFLEGAVVTGDAIRIISIFEITRYPEFMDLGIEEVIFKTDPHRRRRLLSVSSVFGHLTGFAKSGLGSLFSITKTFSSAVAGNLFSGADLGSLMASQNPVASIIGTSFTMPVLAWAQVTYESLLPVALDLLANAQNYQFNLKPIWVHMYDTLDLYDHVIHHRHKQACTGIRLMIGYSSSLGKAVYYNCLAAAEMPRGVWTVALTAFVDMSLYRCLCVNPLGQEYLAYTMKNCEYLMSSNRKGLWQNILSTQNINDVCAQYSVDIERQFYGAFDTWTKYSFLSAEAITSVLDEFFVMRTQAMDCNNLNGNPSAMVLHPMPSHHFHVCAKTTSCRQRCEDSIAVFEAEHKRVQKSGSLSALRKQNYYSHDVESPFFNKYNSDWTASTSGSTGLLQSRNRFIRAIKTNLNSGSHHHPMSPCLERCKDANGYCLVTLIENIHMSTSSYLLEYLCIPSAGSILASVYHSGTRDYQCLKSLENMKKREGFKISHVEFSIQNSSSYSPASFVYVYAIKQTTAVSINPSSVFAPSVAGAETNEIMLWKCDPVQSAESSPEYVLKSVDIESLILGTNIKRALFGDIQLFEVTASSCKILVCVEIYSGIPNQFTLFFSCSLQIKVSYQDDETLKTKTEENAYVVHGIRHYCDDKLESSSCREEYAFSMPYEFCIGLSELTAQIACNQMRNPRLDAAIKMLQQGSLLHLQDKEYFFLPTNNYRMKFDEESGELVEDIYFGSDNFASKGVLIEIDPFKGVVLSKSNRAYRFNSNPDGSTSSALGSWSRLDVFSTSLVTVKPIRGIHMHSYIESNNKQTNFYYQVDQPGAASALGTSLDTEWLQQARIKQRSGGWEIQFAKSAVTTRQSSLVIFCNVSSCLGCGTSKLRLLCHAAQDCTLSKCIGTLVQTRNVFCGVGSVFEKMALHAIMTWKAIFMSGAEIALILMRGLSGETIQDISLKFPTDQFYALVCSCKDTFASMVGLCMSLVQTLSSYTAWGGSGHRMTGSQGLSISGDTEDIGALIGEQNLKTASVGGLFFNMITSSTLIPALALHRFLICTINSSLALSEENYAQISIQFEDVAMDQTWAACVKVGGISNLVNSIDMSTNIGTIIEAFVSFSLSLLSGLGETVLYALQLSFDSTVDLFISLVWSLQDILYTFNMRSCKVPNYALRYVLSCTCNDENKWIPRSARSAGLSEGALWCVGTLSVNLLDGTPNAIIYNPYSLDELSSGIQGITDYIHCLSTQGDAVGCQKHRQQQTQMLPLLGAQGVEPIAVWAKCKVNYLHKSWDNAAGAAFIAPENSVLENSRVNAFSSVMTSNDRTRFISWAQSISPAFLECMREISRLKLDYSSCMNMYFSERMQKTRDAYYVYNDAAINDNIMESEPPDACTVFSGIANSCPNNGSTCTPLQQQFRDCASSMQENADSGSYSTDSFLIEEDYEKTRQCEMNPTMWSSTQSNKVGIAKYHGTAPPWFKENNPTLARSMKQKYAYEGYAKAKQSLDDAWRQFNSTFDSDARDIDVTIFSADGDFIHSFIDCMFLGPYTRVDFYPCDEGGELDCPFYARDENAGMSREFTKCFGKDLTHNDSIPPYTCGSRERRSIIKYFFREIMNKQNLRMNISNHIQATIRKIFENYTDNRSLGCFDNATQTCRLDACSFENGFAPCLDTNYKITSEDTEKLIIEMVLKNLPSYFQKVMQDTLPWTLYSNVSRPSSRPEHPFQWKSDPYSQHAALRLGHFSPTEPIVSYSKSEIYTMPKPEEKTTALSSLWGGCMALLSQPSFNIPLEEQNESSRVVEVPIGFWSTFLSSPLFLEDSEKNNASIESKIEELTKSITEAAMKSHSPFYWHRNRRHAPSISNFCKKSQESPYLTAQTSTEAIKLIPLSLSFGDENQHVMTTAVPDPKNGSWIRQYGFMRNTIGEAHMTCACGTISKLGQEYCDVSPESCESFVRLYNKSNLNLSKTCNVLVDACNSKPTKYARKQAFQVTACLKSMEDGRVRCPEFELSDIWGFFPVDCSEEECISASSWVSAGTSDITFETTRFLNEGRGGIRLSNYRHHNQTYHEAMNFKVQGYKSAADFAIETCYAQKEELSQDAETEEKEKIDLAATVNGVLSRLFPLTQVVFESHVLASCSRFVIEIARAHALDFLDESSSEEALLQAIGWKQKCASKIKHLKMCNFLGMFFEIPPPQNWKDLAKPTCPKIITELESDSSFSSSSSSSSSLYLTPWCILVNQTSKNIYDMPTCYANRQSLFKCSPMTPSPFLLLDKEHDTPLSMLYGVESQPMLPAKHSILELKMSQPSELFTTTENGHSETIFQNGINILDVYRYSNKLSKPDADHVSHVLDWWSDEIVSAAPGFHVTASSDLDELAPILFDSHFAYDDEKDIAFYMHTALRNQSLMHDFLGACGICRLQTIHMPLMDANTNRICTRMSKHAGSDVPTFPVDKLKQPTDSVEWQQLVRGSKEETKFLDQHFETEYCAESAFQVPWQVFDYDRLSATAGGIPDWNLFTFTENQGKNVYRSSMRDIYPAYDGDFNPMLRSFDHSTIFSSSASASKDWGPCLEAVSWKYGIECDTEDQNKMCPQDGKSVCLKFKEDSTSGMCYPLISSHGGEVQQHKAPCFAGFHCPDQHVCHANGKCGPLYLHVWNDNSFALEFSVVADSCGFDNPNHPYTQSSLGASPWERVPDLLSAHGFCSLRNWFSYRHSINTQLCPTKFWENEEYLECNPQNISWPWIKYDTKRNPLDTMEKEKFLHMQPHACDKEYFHMGNPNDNTTRLKFCSGYQGHQKPILANAHYVYDLHAVHKNWSQSTLTSALFNQNISYWMRSFEAQKVEVSKLQYDPPRHNFPLGFLGADQQSPHPAMKELTRLNADGKEFRFFKCADRMTCQLPSFTYNGITTNRIDPSLDSFNFSENSLRKCGAIGYIDRKKWNSEDIAQDICILDIKMFPLFATLLRDNKACLKLLFNVGTNPLDQFRGFMKVTMTPNDIREYVTTATNIGADKTTILCSTATTTTCVYRARSSHVLTEANENDHIQIITTRLNNLIYLTTNQIASSSSPLDDSYRTFEGINQCTRDIITTRQQEQVELQKKYNSMDAGGIYIAMRFGLYELPVKWLHHAWCIALLSKIHPFFPKPNLETDLDLPLWNNKDREIYCSDTQQKSILLDLVCSQKTLEHTFYDTSDDENSLVSKLHEDIEERALTNIRDIVISSENAKVYCYTSASWKCDQLQLNETKRRECMDSMYFLHSKSCPEEIASRPTEFLDPCQHPSNFRMDPSNLVELPLRYYGSRSSDSISVELSEIKQIIERVLRDAIPKTAQEINYAATESTGVLSKIKVLNIDSIFPLLNASAQYRNLDTDFESWFNQFVCMDTYRTDPEYACKKQEEIDASNECLYPNTIPPEEFFRHAQENDEYVEDESQHEVITITYSDERKDRIRVCDELLRTTSMYEMKSRKGEYCLLQHFRNVSSYLDEDISDVEHPNIPCDIKKVSVPPGIEVQAFVFSYDKAKWTNNLLYPEQWRNEVCEASQERGVRSCSWSQNDVQNIPDKTSSWFYGSVPSKEASLVLGTDRIASYIQRSDPLEIDFSDMKDWWKSQKDIWQREGCGGNTYAGVCALRFRLERVPTESEAYCNTESATCYPHRPPSSSSSIYSRFHSFACTKTTNIAQTRLFRCAPCTRAERTVNKKSRGGLFGCHIQQDQKKVTTISREYIEENIKQRMPYIQFPESLESDFFASTPSAYQRFSASTGQDGSLGVFVNTVPLDDVINTYNWKKKTTEIDEVGDSTEANSPTITTTHWRAWTKSDQDRWEYAIKNPHRYPTMDCGEQRLAEEDFVTCNQNTDKRRKLLETFVENMYRKRNGLWLSRVEPHQGYAWQANVGNPRVGLFSIAYASVQRSPVDQIVARHVLGNAICREEKNTNRKDRICMESIAYSHLKFEQFHPWLGGDMNPFEGKRGLDQCSNEICPCNCFPEDNCRDSKGIYNYTDEDARREFPDEDACRLRRLPQFYAMEAGDPSNLCSYLQIKSDADNNMDACLHTQGIFGGLNGRDLNKRVSAEILYSQGGSRLKSEEVLVQDMYSLDQNDLWMGSALFELTDLSLPLKAAFLTTQRSNIYPAHIAFGLDHEKTNSPLVLKAMGLLPLLTSSSSPPRMPEKLEDPKRWLKRLYRDCATDHALASRIYPPAAWLSSPSNVNTSRGHWSCPFRMYSFWGDSGDDQFSPQIPNPVALKYMFSSRYSNCREGAHPLVKMTTARGALKSYKTTNGYCFYEADAQILNVEHIELGDASNPCGLKQMLWHIHENTWALSRVMNHFRQRCDTIIDYPELGAKLRNGETMPGVSSAKCGVLHRLSPFLMRTKGDAAIIQASRSLTTHSKGGDCHMGRSIRWPFSRKIEIDGRECFIASDKNSGDASVEFQCRISKKKYATKRVTPLSTQHLKQKPQEEKKLKRFMTDDLSAFVTFLGPGGVKVSSEVSFGLHYSVSLPKMLADDYIKKCKSHQVCQILGPWPGGGEFMRRYTKWPSSNFVRMQSQKTPKKNERLWSDLTQDVPAFVASLRDTQTPENNIKLYTEALLRDAVLWNTPNWTWSYYIPKTNESNTSNQFVDRRYTGTVNKTLWKKNRFEACKASHDDSIARKKTQLEYSSTLPITLCEPAPTGGLQEFCRKLLQYRTNIARINCQVMGNDNECLYKPSMFYVPYAWSNTNQEFAAETTMRYYNQTIASKFKDERMDRVCPYRSELYANMVKLSMETKHRCPAEQVEYLKDTLNSIKSIGKEILYMGYCLLMFVLNAVSMALTLTGQAAASMSAAAAHYLEEFFNTAGRIIMPILNAMISLLFGTSSAGKIMKEVLMYLCEIYNWVMDNIIVKVWCTVTLPCLQIIIEAIKFFIPNVKEIDMIWKVLSGGHSGFDVKACIGRLHLTLDCRPPDHSRSYNASEFQAAHLATRCWIDSTIKNGYSSSVFGGSSDFSFLSCSVSDTCAKESTKIDDYIMSESNLVPCASCPEVDLQDSPLGQKFGCNAALKRCTCSVNSYKVSECLTNSDCSSFSSSDSAVCGVASMLDSIRNAPSNILCSQCGQYGQQPVCVIDGNAETGVCGCASISDATFLASCPTATIGQPAPLIPPKEKCLFYPNEGQGNAAVEIQQLHLDFSDTAIGPCLLGASTRKCLAVTLPSQNQYSQSKPRAFVVILNYRMQYSANMLATITNQQQIVTGGSRRRLLSSDKLYSRNQTLLRIVQSCNHSGSRQDIKKCIHHKIMRGQAEAMFQYEKDLLPKSYHEWRWKALLMPRENDTSDLSQFLSYQWSAYDDTEYSAHLISHAADNIVYQSLEFLVDFFALRPRINEKNATLKLKLEQEHRKTRSLLSSSAQEPETQPVDLPPISCYALQKPISAISRAFWDTAALYNSMHNTNLQAPKQEDEGASCAWWYSYPPLSTNSSSRDSPMTWTQAVSHQLLSWVFSGGSASGEQIMEAMTSNLSHEESVEKNYFTGNRFVREISQCNFTTLTFGPKPRKDLMPWLLALLVAAYVLASFFSSSLMISTLIWLVFFPIALFWTVYNVSPLCWPMIPPKLPHDLAAELSSMIPKAIKIPYFVVADECLSYKTFLYEGETIPLPTSDDVMSKISNANVTDKRKCFKKCTQSPFYFENWQDPLAWWTCDVSTDFCNWISRIADNLPGTRSYVQSVRYFLKVLERRNIDPEYVQAFRFCAFFNSHDTIMAAILALCILLIGPSLIQFVVEVFTGAIVLVIHASSSEIIE